MHKGGISPSGRVLRFVLWRLPVQATRFSIARNTAAATEEGRRVLALAGFGAWVAAFWWLATLLHAWTGLVVPLQLAGLFGLLLVWRLVGLARRWWIHRRNLTAMAVSTKRQREMYEMQAQALDLLRQGVRQAIPGGTFTMLGSMRQHDPVRDEHDRLARDQATQVRGMLGDTDRDLPLGEQFEPIWRLPRWLRRRGGR